MSEIKRINNLCRTTMLERHRILCKFLEKTHFGGLFLLLEMDLKVLEHNGPNRRVYNLIFLLINQFKLSKIISLQIRQKPRQLYLW